jgi:hypothetical protein
MGLEESNSRVLTTSEQGHAVAVGVVMLFLAFLSLTVTVALYSPLARLVEGLSK